MKFCKAMRQGSRPRAIFRSVSLSSVMAAAGLLPSLRLVLMPMPLAFSYERSLAPVQPIWPTSIANRGKHFGIGGVAALGLGYGSRSILGLAAVCSSGAALDRFI